MTESGRPIGAIFSAKRTDPALVVAANDGPVRPGQGGGDEVHPQEQLAEVMLDLRDHPSWRSHDAA